MPADLPQVPSGGNQQGWHWLVITDQDTRAAIGELYTGETFRPVPRGPVQEVMHINRW
jgi:nitroreductase